jgi:hypothetical protein
VPASQGIDQIAGLFAGAGAGVSLSAGAELGGQGDEPDVDGVGMFVQLGAQLGRVATALERQQADAMRLGQVIREVPITSPQIQISAGAGQLDEPDLLEAKTGYCWSIRRLTAWGYTAGSVEVFKNSANGELMFPFPSQGVATFGRGEQRLMPGDRLVFVASGITLSGAYTGIQIGGAADCFESWYLPYYIG